MTFPTINSEIKALFRWYQTADLQNRCKEDCLDKCEYALAVPATRLLPFQLWKIKSLDALTYWYVYDLDGNLVADLTSDLGLITTWHFQTYTYHIYNGQNISVPLPEGEYLYSVISDGNMTWTSEVFQPMCYSTGVQLLNDSNFTDEVAAWDTFNDGGSGSVVQGAGEWCWTGATSIGIQQAGAFPTLNVPYIITIVVASYTTGNWVIDPGGGTQVAFSGTGTHTFTVVPTTNDTLKIGSKNSLTGCLDSVTINGVDANGEECHMKLEWLNTCGNVGFQYYPAGYMNEFYLPRDCAIINGTPRIIEEGTESGGKEFVPTFKRHENEFRVALGLHPWYVVDALNEMVLHDKITLKMKHYLGSDEILRPRLTITWDPAGDDCLATVNLFFQLDEASIIEQCCDTDEEFVLDECFDTQPVLDMSGVSEYACENSNYSGTAVNSGVSKSDTWEWKDSGGNVVSTTDTLAFTPAALSDADTYTVTVTNSYGCSATATVNLGVCNQLLADTLSIVDESFPGACDGSVQLTYDSLGGCAGDRPTYINLTDVVEQETDTFTGLCAGNYDFQVRLDPSGCLSNIINLTIN